MQPGAVGKSFSLVSAPPRRRDGLCTKDCTRECISDGCNAGLDGAGFAATAVEQARTMQSMRRVTAVDEHPTIYGVSLVSACQS